MRARLFQRAFTLVELLVVIAIIGILIALLLPAVQAAREAARRMQCTNNLKQMGIAVHGWHDARGAIPPCLLTGRGHATWAGIILPFLENGILYDQCEIENRTVYYLWHTVGLRELMKQPVPAFSCPSRTGLRLSINDTSRVGVGPVSGACIDYAINVGDGNVIPFWSDPSASPPRICNGISPSTHTGPLTYNGTLSGSEPFLIYSGWKGMRSFRDISDGLSNTLLIGEKHLSQEHIGDYNFGDGTYFSDDSPGQTCRMAGPRFPLAESATSPGLGNPLYLYGRFGSWHAGGVCSFVFADGSVQSLTPAIDSVILGNLANYSDGNVIPDDAF
ncbi:MAG: DUF1559 domain-containing protein [Pirellulales bacterium]|nr:DUF1559 domain-containing protein [Pirellulales bacterium]